MRTLRSLQSTDLHGKRVIVRASLDVPIEDGVVTNDFRIKKTLPTLSFLIEKGARVILMTHVGRDPENTTKPIADALRAHFPIEHIEAVTGAELEKKVAALHDGEILLLGNLRSEEAEEGNDEAFANTLAFYGEIYVNDAFAVSHRAHASIVGIPALIPGYAGLTFEEEYENLSRALTPEHPALFILGGAKFETKAPLIERYSESYDTVALGGALANDFLKGRGCEVGMSLVSDVDLSDNPLLFKENVIVPIDVVTSGSEGDREGSTHEIEKDERILDVGPASIEALRPYIEDAKTILWNGPLGYYEGGYDTATKACAELIAHSKAFSIVGGGDTVAAIESLGLAHKFGFLSTAGGAMLEFLEKGTLPGIEALK
jgi:phosphoglycerate kinase